MHNRWFCYFSNSIHAVLCPTKGDFRHKPHCNVVIVTDLFSIQADKVTISDNKILDELKIIFFDSNCRRSLDKEKAIQYKSTSSTINLHMLIMSEGKNYPLHFNIGNDYSIKYTSTNTDFICLI